MMDKTDDCKMHKNKYTRMFGSDIKRGKRRGRGEGEERERKRKQHNNTRDHSLLNFYQLPCILARQFILTV